MFCYLTGMEPYYIQCVKDGPFQPKTSEGAIKPEFQWTNDERRVVNQDQRLKNTIISCLPDEIMESCISCETAKATWAKLVHSFKEVSEDEEMTQVKVLMALVDDELVVGKNHARNSEWIDITMRKAPTDPESSKESDSEPQTSLPSLKIFHRASPSSKVMPLTYQDHSPRERPGLGTMKHTKPETQESSSKSVSGPVTISDTKPVTSLVPTEVKNTEQDSKIDELTKLVQMLLDEKINSSQKTQEPKTKSSNSASSSKISQDVKHKILKAKAKPFPPCTHCGCHHPGDCRNYPECAISEAMTISPQDIIVSFKGGVLAESS
ncbi:hypothetical protein Tco_0079130 [Tanacetum coccineum]